jgi:glycosyltransferase 2 family protein
MNSRTLSTVIKTAKFVLPLAIIIFLVYQIGPEHWRQIQEQPKNYGFLVAAIAVALVAMAISFVRWCVLVRCQDIELTMMEAFRLGAIGYLLAFISVGSVGGDLFKAVFLARRRPGRRIAAVASVLVDRGCGLYGLLLLVAGGLWVSGASPQALMQAEASSFKFSLNIDDVRRATLFLVGLGTAVLAVLILGGKVVDRAIDKLSRLPMIGSVVAKIGPPLRTFHTHPFSFAFAVLLSVLVQGLLVISMYLIAIGLYSDPPTLAQHFVIVPIGMLVSALPLTPGGVGVLEMVIEGMYRLFQPADAIASGTLVSLVFELVKLFVAAIGVVFYWTAGDEVNDTVQAAQQEDIDQIATSS